MYPAGFLYAFTVLRWLTGGGSVRPGQYLFAGIYLATLAVVLWLYIRAKARTAAGLLKCSCMQGVVHGLRAMWAAT